MSHVGMFRLLLTLQVLLSFAVPAAAYYAHASLPQYAHASLPQPIRQYLDNLPDFPDPNSMLGQYLSAIPNTILLTLAITMVLVLIVNLIGLWLLRNWARHLYLAITIIGFALLALDYQTPVIYSTAESLLWDLLNITTGASIAMMYLPPLADRFKTPTAKRTNT